MNRAMSIRYIAMVIFVSVLAGCTPVPKFERPNSVVDKMALFVNDPNSKNDWKTVTQWWERIGDPTLNDYVELLLNENLSLKEAAERIIQAKERVGIQKGGFFPSLSLGADASRSFQPANSSTLFGGGSTGGNRIYATSLNAELSTAWEIDLFGKIRSSMESASASLAATEFDVYALEQSLIAELIRLRVAIAVNHRLLELAHENAENQGAIYNLVKRRYELGTQGTTLADVYLAEENVRSVEADIHDFQRQLTEQIYALDVLLGRAPGTSEISTYALPLLPTPESVAICIPAALLDRRPDLRASEFRAIAANADIGVAIADLYPNISLGGAIGFSGSETSGFFTSDQLAGSLLSSITMRLFQGGALRANIRLQESEARALAIQYTADILNALKEVETALHAERELSEELAYKRQSVSALKKAETLTENRYRKGIVPLREFLETQQRRYQIEQNWLLTSQERWLARINLYLSLGGDWFEPERSRVAVDRHDAEYEEINNENKAFNNTFKRMVPAYLGNPIHSGVVYDLQTVGINLSDPRRKVGSRSATFC